MHSNTEDSRKTQRYQEANKKQATYTQEKYKLQAQHAKGKAQNHKKCVDN